MTDFPDRIEISLLNKINKKPIQNVIGLITLFANHKNDYHMFTPLSDENGTISITKVWLENQIFLEANTAIMDYSSGLEDCRPRIEFGIVGEQVIKKAMESLFIWANIVKEFQTDVDNLKLAENKKYIPNNKIINIIETIDMQKIEVFLDEV